MEQPTLDDLYLLARDQPVVYQALFMYQRGDITLEHALIGMVLVLSGQVKDLEGKLIDCIARSPQPFVIPRNS